MTPVVAVKVEAAESTSDAAPALSVELRLKPGWTYRGRLFADGADLEGELEMAPEVLNLR